MKAKTRKQARKEFRKAKKVKKHEFFSKKRLRSQQADQHGNRKSTEKGKEEKSSPEINLAQKVDKSVKKDKNRKEFKNPQEKFDFEKERERKQKEKLEREIHQQRIKQLKADNLREDEEIRKLEKQLKMRKGKYKAFASDGLDYLLDICDKANSKNVFETAMEESDSEFDSDIQNIIGVPKKTQTSKKEIKLNMGKKNDESISDESDSEQEYSFESEAESEDLDNDECFTAQSSNIDSEQTEQPRKKADESNIKNKKRKTDKEDGKLKKNMLLKEKYSESDLSTEEEVNLSSNRETGGTSMWEDIYGRTRDEKGNVVTTYVPPHLRKNPGREEASEKFIRLKKQLKGLLNRLAESNMAFISNQVEQLYMSNSRNDMNETLCTLFCDSLVTEVITPERLITEHAMLIAVLHANVGSEIGAHFLQYFVLEFCKMLKSKVDVEDKRINNILSFILQLYNFQIFHSKLMYDLINELLKNLEEKQIELLLTTFRTVGFNLRKDDPMALKLLILKVQEQINTVSAGENSSRVKFMLEMLMAIKNNNMSKIPNFNPEFVEKLRKNLKVFVRKGNYGTELNISLQDLLNEFQHEIYESVQVFKFALWKASEGLICGNAKPGGLNVVLHLDEARENALERIEQIRMFSAEKHGRWWIVGSAWSGSAPAQPDTNKAKPENVPSTEFSQKLLELAKKQRMNTDVRRTIFCILMSAEDFLEAFEKLLKLKLKGAVEREIANVLLHCALQEKNFNPYYVFLANKFCIFDRKYQMMFQCAIWDRIKELRGTSPVHVTNLAKFVGNLILEKGLPISILKVIQFSELDKPTMKFMRQVLLAILVNDDRNAVAAVFKRIADSPKLKLFRESLRLFLQHFVQKNAGSCGDQERVSRVLEMIKVAEQALISSEGAMVF